MMYMPSILLCLVFVQEPALEIANLRPTYGYLGAPRERGPGILPGDVVHFTFEIKNLKLDEHGKAAYSIGIEIRDDQGKLFYEQRPYNSVARNLLGGPSLPCSAHIAIPLNAKPGMYDWKITVKDRTTKQSTTLAGKSKILPADFGIVQVGLFADPESRVPASAIGVVGDSYYLQFSAVGFSRQKDSLQPNLNVSLRVLDDAGKQPESAKPLTAKINSDIDPKEQHLPIQFGLTLNRAGRFTLELSAEDRVSGKTARVLYRIRVLPLEEK
jgi:hypothetical protein